MWAIIAHIELKEMLQESTGLDGYFCEHPVVLHAEGLAEQRGVQPLQILHQPSSLLKIASACDGPVHACALFENQLANLM